MNTINDLKNNNPNATKTEMENKVYSINPDMRTYCYYLFTQADKVMLSDNVKEKDNQLGQQEFEYFEEYMNAHGFYPKFQASTFKQALQYVKERKEGRPLSYFQHAKNITSSVVNRGLTGAGIGAVAGMASAQMNREINPAVTTLVGGTVGAVGGVVQAVKDIKNTHKEAIDPLKPNIMKTENVWQRIRNYIYTPNSYLN